MGQTESGAFDGVARRVLPTVASCVALASILVAAAPSFAAWRSQTITLQPGWNAVFLEVQPVPDAVETVFAGMPVRSVWMWNRRYSPVQFIQDTFEMDTAEPPPQWLVWYAATEGERFRSLHAIQGGRAYLIRLDGAQPVTWQLTGKAVIVAPEWVADSYNLTGFYVDPAQPPTLTSVLAGSTELQPTRVYRLNAAGQWVHLDTPNSELAHSGEAFWIYCKGPSTYAGPLRVILEQAGEVNFGRVLTEQVVSVRNEGTTTRQVSLRTLPADAPPPGGTAGAGDVPLSYFDKDTLAWVDFTGERQLSLAPGTEWNLRVAVRRPHMAGGDGSLPYQSLLEMNDGAGTRLLASVEALGMAAGGASARTGLWVGTATVNRVSHAGADTALGRTTPVATSSDMGIRVILHVDEAGQVRLLQHVTLMWKDGTYKPDPLDPTKQVTDQPGREVLVVRDALLPQFKGAALRDGQQIGRRIASAAFGFDAPVSMTGAFDSALHSGDLVLPFNDALNPFVHKYHPDHDNLDFDFEPTLGDGAESFTITRNIDFNFTSVDPQDLQVAGWGDTQLGGTYAERIRGLHRETIYLAGTFRLQHVSRVAILDDGL